MKLCLLFILFQFRHMCLCGGCKMSPRTSSLCSHIFLVLRDHWLYVCLHFKMEFHSCARGRQWCGIFHYHWWTASIKPRLLFSHSGLVSWGLPFLQFNTCNYVPTKCGIFNLWHSLPIRKLTIVLQFAFLRHSYHCPQFNQHVIFGSKNLNGGFGPANANLNPVFSDLLGNRCNHVMF